ncbi:MAG: cytochrome c4 [Rickettsiales bacterium]|nr:cytochrome c4 [Rickettsiales bacterium]|tara:strand:+ start:1454 stop:2050 length:597 start_codon:yes stop_codon:yes gene_type:complete
MDLRKLTIPFFAILLLGLGNIQSGKEKAETCIACHGEDGNSVVGLWPSLAGQNTNYLKKQLRLIQSGERPIPVMNGQLDGYDDQDLEDMAAYYASKKNKIGEASADLVEQGFKLYYAGSLEKGIPACTACHSPRGRGNSPAGYPLLSGQKTEYISKTLKDYRVGDRQDSEQSEIMVSIAYKLDDKEIEALASFINGLY